MPANWTSGCVTVRERAARPHSDDLEKRKPGVTTHPAFMLSKTHVMAEVFGSVGSRADNGILP